MEGVFGTNYPTTGRRTGHIRPIRSLAYFKTLPVLHTEPESVENNECLILVKAYILDDKFLDSKFQNAAVDAILERGFPEAQDEYGDVANKMTGSSYLDTLTSEEFRIWIVKDELKVHVLFHFGFLSGLAFQNQVSADIWRNVTMTFEFTILFNMVYKPV
ncbi:hypothetical protein PISL3812_05511 [Talaromyces islandicus]|uniref:Uncharacterized protein n=1 Tax=Talaromyces islandicus TaxID=28573 RepID=A0A0U1M0G8_TALIS|nr:hypothetical protein PISL3812_05511 [Talaromyces islandicus]